MTSILITGGTGFLGNALVEEILNRRLSERVCIYSRDEHKQASMRTKHHDDERLRFFVGDVRDVKRLRRAMHGVDIVIHAAALKRIEVGQYNPDEMLKTNVHGAINVIEAAADAVVPKVVAISTDKAYRPVSPYGFSKALAENLFLAANETHPSTTRYAVVRYGNVAGSTGSVIPKWRDLVDKLGVVPVTDPDCTRFWMTIEHAVRLVINTSIGMCGGELVIPALPAYRLGDLAEAMGAKMNIRGLPAHEKLHESMADDNCSETATRMSVEQLKMALTHVN